MKIFCRKVAIMVLLSAGVLNAQFILSLSNPIGRVQSSFPAASPSIGVVGPLTSAWYRKSGDTTHISSAMLSGVYINFARWLSVSMTIPYYYDLEKVHNSTLKSRGKGDPRLAFELRKKIGKTSYISVVPFFTLPFGELRDVPPSQAKNNENYTGGLFRDYSTGSYDYGLEFLFSKRVRKSLISFNMGFWNAYQLNYMGKSGNLGYFATNLLFNLGKFNPFVEFYYSKYQNNVFGNAPIFLTPGLILNLSNSLKIKSYIDIPLFNRGDVQLVGEKIVPNYPGFLSQFPDYTPSLVFNMGIEIAPHLISTSDKSRVIVFVKDSKTNEPLNKADCYLDEKYESGVNGRADFGLIDKGIYELKVFHKGYLPVKKFVKVKGGEKQIIDVRMKKDRFVLIIQVRDIKGQPKKANIIFPEVGSEVYSTDKDGNIEFEIKKIRDFYPVFIWAKGYTADNILIYSPEEKDTLLYTVHLLKIEGGGIVFPAIYFDLNSARLKKTYLPFLDQIGKYLLKNPDVKIEIYGYASSDGPRKFNQKLSDKRAEACKNYLIERYKISPERLITQGFGEANPALPNVGRKREINRRVEFKVIK